MQPLKLCSLNDLPDQGAKGIVIGSGLEQFRYIVVRDRGDIRCYINRCPHMGTPLDTFPDKFLDEKHEFLVCSTHGARFGLADGVCVSGPCVGLGLAPCQILVSEGQVYLMAQPADIF